MRLHTSEAILLDVRDLQDRDRIVTFFTREQGKKRGVAQGARTRHSRFGGQLQPLAKVSVTWFEKEGRDLARLSAVELIRPAHRLFEDLDGILLGSYLADHLLEFAPDAEPNDPLYRLLDVATEALLGGADRSLVARYFETWVLRLAGIFPAPSECPACGRVLADTGARLPRQGDALLCPDCAAGRGSLSVSRDAVALLLGFHRHSLAQLGSVSGGGAVAWAETLQEIEGLCGEVRRGFLGRELRTYEVMQQTRLGSGVR